MLATSSWPGGGFCLALGFLFSQPFTFGCGQHRDTHCAGGARGHRMGGVRQGPKSPVPHTAQGALHTWHRRLTICSELPPGPRGVARKDKSTRGSDDSTPTATSTANQRSECPTVCPPLSLRAFGCSSQELQAIRKPCICCKINSY